MEKTTLQKCHGLLELLTEEELQWVHAQMQGMMEGEPDWCTDFNGKSWNQIISPFQPTGDAM